MCSSRFPSWCGRCESVYMGVDQDENWVCTESTQWSWLLLWIWQGLEKFCVSSTTMVIKTELWTGVHSPVVRAADYRSAGPWFNSGWRHWIHTHWHVQRINIMSPILTTITMPMTTIPRKSVNMVAELALWIPDTTERQEEYSAVAKATTMTAVALDTKVRAAQRAVIRLKSALDQSQQSRTEAKTQADYLSLIALKLPSDFGADTVPHRRVLCQALACGWREGSKCAPADQLLVARLHVLLRRPGDTLVGVDQHPRRRLPGPRNGLVGHRSWSLTDNHHNNYPQGPKAVALFLCDRPTFALLTPL